MDAATIFVLVATMLFVGFIVWVNIYGRREAERKSPTTSDGNPKPIAESESPTNERIKKMKRNASG